ncbi:hypothetical protein NC653_038877 [Populus alba x Populus x berolinensis]|uniref:Uncharacterized protein n=1 Tax=Populus alba x Populus x berolinensis TaxID=444605 RepID=A0AAD6PPZ5_9ROSI|nr:hypothetical protein NC653_038877 [Populus alba x Populus x berolinensis]
MGKKRKGSRPKSVKGQGWNTYSVVEETNGYLAHIRHMTHDNCSASRKANLQSIVFLSSSQYCFLFRVLKQTGVRRLSRFQNKNVTLSLFLRVRKLVTTGDFLAQTQSQFLMRRRQPHEVPWERKSKGLPIRMLSSPFGIYHTSFRCHGNTPCGFSIRYLQGSVFSSGTQFQLPGILGSSSFVQDFLGEIPMATVSYLQRSLNGLLDFSQPRHFILGPSTQLMEIMENLGITESGLASFSAFCDIGLELHLPLDPNHSATIFGNLFRYDTINEVDLSHFLDDLSKMDWENFNILNFLNAQFPEFRKGIILQLSGIAILGSFGIAGLPMCDFRML